MVVLEAIFNKALSFQARFAFDNALGTETLLNSLDFHHFSYVLKKVHSETSTNKSLIAQIVKFCEVFILLQYSVLYCI